MTITADIQKLEPGEKLTLYELDMTSIGSNILLFHGYQQQGSIWWQGREYVPWAIQADGFSKVGMGQQPSPTLRVGNIGMDISGNPVPGVISSLCTFFDDLVGSKLTRHITFSQYLDAVNFPGGVNPTADPAQEFPVDIWYIEQKTAETSEIVEFMLSSSLDMNNVQIPGRDILNGICSWVRIGGYRGSYCGYTGPNMFDAKGNPVTSLAQDVCGGRLSDCKLRFGQYSVLSFGGFPAAGLVT